MAKPTISLLRRLRDGQAVRLRLSYGLAIAAMHVLAILALWPAFFSWSGVAVFAVMYYLSGGLGITLGYHRLLTHRSFRTYKPVEYTLALLACLAWQGGPIRWVGTHRLHHTESDQPGDPHSPRDGFGWAHMFWVVYHSPNGENVCDYAKDLQRDKMLAWLDRFWWMPQFFLAAVLFMLGWLMLGTAIGGLSWVLWGVCMRVVFQYHATWLVNSGSHLWGYRRFDTGDDSRNNWWIALLSFGEGWHNNHHAQQRSAAHGMRWYEFDITYITINIMHRLGLAWDIVRPKPA